MQPSVRAALVNRYVHYPGHEWSGQRPRGRTGPRCGDCAREASELWKILVGTFRFGKCVATSMAAQNRRKPILPPSLWQYYLSVVQLGDFRDADEPSWLGHSRDFPARVPKVRERIRSTPPLLRPRRRERQR